MHHSFTMQEVCIRNLRCSIVLRSRPIQLFAIYGSSRVAALFGQPNFHFHALQHQKSQIQPLRPLELKEESEIRTTKLPSENGPFWGNRGNLIHSPVITGMNVVGSKDAFFVDCLVVSLRNLNDRCYIYMYTTYIHMPGVPNDE